MDVCILNGTQLFFKSLQTGGLSYKNIRTEDTPGTLYFFFFPRSLLSLWHS